MWVTKHLQIDINLQLKCFLLKGEGAAVGLTNLAWLVPLKRPENHPMEIRKVIYTTNVIELLDRSLRKVIQTKAVFPDEGAVFAIFVSYNQFKRV
jgi:hypothetical protein